MYMRWFSQPYDNLERLLKDILKGKEALLWKTNTAPVVTLQIPKVNVK